jgi:light-regulated signal transduction histidine kinase (bacteriophytochrome)
MSMTGIDDEKRKSYINRALREVKKSSSIIKDVKIMSLAKPVGEPVPTSLSSTIEDVMARFRKEQNDIIPAVEMDIADLHVLADDMIEEGFIRILDHSMIIREGKVDRISIIAKRDPSKSSLVSEAVHITITTEWEEEVGDEVDYVFDRPKRTDLGSRGLGLYLVKRIIDRFGGMIWVDKLENGKGTIVNILLKEAV